MLELFEDDDPRTLPHDESVACRVERARRGGRRIVPLGKCLHVREATNGHRCHGRFGASTQDDVGIAVLDGSKRIADGVSTRGARGDGRVVRPLGIEAHRHDAGRNVGNEHRDEEGRDLRGSARLVHVVLLLERPQPANAAADDDAGTLGIVAVSFGESRVLHRLHRGGDGVLRVCVSALGLFAVHEQNRIEALDLGGEANRERARIELRDGPRPRFPRQEGTPSRRHVVADRREASEPRDDDPTPHQAFTFSRR
jgi:hypothetical protein